MTDTVPTLPDAAARRRRRASEESAVSGEGSLRPGALVPYQPGQLSSEVAAVPALSGDAAAVRDAGQDIGEGHKFAHPSEEFPHWPEIIKAVFDEFVARSGTHNSNPEAEKQPERYFRMVSDVITKHPQWGVQPIALGSLVEMLRVYQFGYGPLEDYMHIDGLEELYFNRYDQGFYIVRGRKSRISESVFANTEALVTFVNHVAGENGLEINAEKPNLDATLKDGSRLNATLEPLAYDGPDFVIRQFREIPFTMEQIIEQGMVTAELAADMRGWVAAGLNFVVSGGTSSGKAQPDDAKVLTPSGWRTMGNLQVGDAVIGADGRAHSVVGVFPQGQKDIYRVTFSDGSQTECCDEHLWAVRTKGQRCRGKKFLVKSVGELRDDLQYCDGSHKWFIPMVEPVEFACDDHLPLDPYTLGALLGDGGLTQTTPRFTTVDAELLTAVDDKLPVGISSRHVSSLNDGIDYSLAGVQGRTNALTSILSAQGVMGCHSFDKFVPCAYKRANAADRLAMLQGLCDIDGSVVSGTPHVEFSTASSVLAADVQWLVRSLGGRASIHSRQPFFTYNSERRAGATSYRLHLCLPMGMNPFRLTRKRDVYRELGRRPPSRAIVAIEPVGLKPAQCIMTDAPDGLYVTDDFIVTHNTTFLNTIGNTFIPKSDRVLVLENRKELQIQTDDTKYFQTREDATRENQANDVGMRELIRWALRKRPDRIIVGEVRGGEAYYALVAWNSGHDGSFCTIHADNAASAVDKLEQLAMESGKLSEVAVRKLISRAVDIVIQVERIKGRGERRVTEVVQVFHPRKYNRRLPELAERVRQLTDPKNENGMYQFSGDLWLLPLYELDTDNQLVKRNDLVPVQGKS